MAQNSPSGAAWADPHAQLEAIIHSSNDAIITKNLDGTITSWNPAAERIFGYSASEAIGQPMLTFIPSDRHGEETDILARIGRGERIEPFETVRLRKGGQAIDVSVSISPIRDERGRVVGASKIARDISERRRAEERMLAIVNELQDIKSALDEHSIVAVTDAAGRITSVNEKFCAISRYSREELLGQDHRIINSGYHSKVFFADLWATIRSGRPWHGEICNRAKDGSRYWVATTIYPCLDAQRQPVQYVAIRTDITQRKADDAQRRRYAEDLAEKNKELETIVYTVSHDLRSPLVNVQGFGKQLARACEKLSTTVAAAQGGAVPAAALQPALETTIPQALRFINAGVSKMDTLLAGLLRFSRLGREALSIRRLDVNALVMETLAAMRFQLDAAKAEVRLGTLPEAFGDKVHTGQVFANLFDNALKYRDPSRPPLIVVEGRIDGELAIFSVADNGMGIAPEHQEKAFEIFHRLNPDGPAGEGLGLTIAQRVLERQRGRIWVESKPGVGSTFFVALPCRESEFFSSP